MAQLFPALPRNVNEAMRMIVGEKSYEVPAFVSGRGLVGKRTMRAEGAAVGLVLVAVVGAFALFYGATGYLVGRVVGGKWAVVGSIGAGFLVGGPFVAATMGLGSYYGVRPL